MPVDLEAIRARAAATFPGPWAWFGNTESHQVHLATAHSGRQILLDPALHQVEYVFHHWHSETYSLEQARARLGEWFPPTETVCTDCGADLDPTGQPDRHAESCSRPGWAPPESAQLVEARAFLAGDLDPLLSHDTRHLRGPDDMVVLARGIHVHADMRFHDRRDTGEPDGLMRSFRDLARYEVLDGRTLAEHEAAGGVIDGERRDLYRSDIVGIDNPEAEFLAHARQDIDALLAEIERLHTQPPPGRRRPTRARRARAAGGQPAPAPAATATAPTATRPVPAPSPPAIEAPVRTRRVMFRGTKEQVAFRLAELGPFPAEAAAAGAERYVEFTPSAVSDKRWRIVVVSAPWTPEQVDATPSEASGAPGLRDALTDTLDSYEDLHAAA